MSVLRIVERESSKISNAPTRKQMSRSLAALAEIERRVLWLAVRMVDHSNHGRPKDEIKTGGHQASSASLVTAMTALWFAHLNADDRVSVKPHASPVLHAINYLLDHLDGRYLTELRAFGGLQAYPSRTKDPDRVDFSTGSVGLGVAAPLFAAAARRYVDAHFGARPRARFIALLGDAELDEGNVWEAINEPAAAGLGNVMWIVDFNRQSLDRVVPGVRIAHWSQQFAAAGWHVVEAKYGRRLSEALAQDEGEALRRWIDDMPNDHYQSLFGISSEDVRKRFLEGAPRLVRSFCDAYADDDLADLVTDLGGHDLTTLLDAYDECDAVPDRPSVVFAYTVKGWGLPMAGNPRNHSALLTGEQIEAMRSDSGLTFEIEWDQLDPASAAGKLAGRRGKELKLEPRENGTDIHVPSSSGLRVANAMSTQEAFGRILTSLSRDENLAPYLVTTAPDVATSTNLAGFINRMGVFSPRERPNWSEDTLLRWVENPTGQHVELGISEMNLFMLLGQLGLTWDISDQRLLPVGTVYDPFVLRGLEAFLYSVYSGARFVVAGTPSGISLAPEGGAHQSAITASVGLELPNVTFVEPTYAGPLDWLLCDALADVGAAERSDIHRGGAYYFRLTTRPLDQGPFADALARVGEEALRRQVLLGGHRLLETEVMDGVPKVYLVSAGPVMKEVLEAAAELVEEGVAPTVIDVTSLDRLYASWQATTRCEVRDGRLPRTGYLDELFPIRAPVITVHDAASHAMAWLGSALGVPSISLGVDSFGQSGTIQDLYTTHNLRPGVIVNAALAILG